MVQVRIPHRTFGAFELSELRASARMDASAVVMRSYDGLTSIEHARPHDRSHTIRGINITAQNRMFFLSAIWTSAPEYSGFRYSYSQSGSLKSTIITAVFGAFIQDAVSDQQIGTKVCIFGVPRSSFKRPIASVGI